jgi:hypothetical protein
MASSFPGSIDNFTDPLSNSALSSPSHAGQHSDLNDAVEKIETYMGLVKVIPTSVAGTGVSLSATGTVTFTSATAITVDGCFTSLYRNYRIEIQGVSNSINAADLQLQFRASGATNATANYFSNILYNTATGGPLRSYVASATVGYVGQTADLSMTNSVDVFAPQIAARTSVMAVANGFGSNTAVVGLSFANFNAATQFDGFTCGAGGTITLTGQLTVYGYRN